MSLWCSLLGHRFEGTEVEREREERDEEVLTVTREVETCRRCGARRVIAENTEVASVEPAPDHVAGDEEPEPAVAGGTSETVEARDPAEEDTEILEGGEPDRAPGEWPPEPGDSDEAVGPAADAGAGADPSGSPSTPPDPPSDDSPDAFVCPECGYAVDAAGSSLRAGDSCPECRTGYLETP